MFFLLLIVVVVVVVVIVVVGNILLDGLIVDKLEVESGVVIRESNIIVGIGKISEVSLIVVEVGIIELFLMMVCSLFSILYSFQEYLFFSSSHW